MNAVLNESPAAASRFTKVSADGADLPADATEWVAVFDSSLNVLWARHAAPERMNYADAKAYCENLELAGLKGWKLPDVEPLFLLADRSRHSPAIDTDYFPECDGGWYWSATLDAESPADCAWGVHFGYGLANCYDQDGRYWVRACRPRQAI
jgi:hypothetical protein